MGRRMNIRKKKAEMKFWICILTVGLILCLLLLIIGATVDSALICSLGLGVLLFCMFLGEHILSIINSLKTLWGKSETEEKVDKLAKALGLRWQVYPERRRWVTKNTPPPELEAEQPELVQHSVRNDT